jgi:hypothetical protein
MSVKDTIEAVVKKLNFSHVLATCAAGLLACLASALTTHATDWTYMVQLLIAVTCIMGWWIVIIFVKQWLVKSNGTEYHPAAEASGV